MYHFHTENTVQSVSQKIKHQLEKEHNDKKILDILIEDEGHQGG